MASDDNVLRAGVSAVVADAQNRPALPLRRARRAEGNQSLVPRAGVMFLGCGAMRRKPHRHHRRPSPGDTSLKIIIICHHNVIVIVILGIIGRERCIVGCMRVFFCVFYEYGRIDGVISEIGRIDGCMRDVRDVV